MNPSAQWVAFCTLLKREFKRSIRVWPQTFLPPIVTTTLYFLIFGRIIGQRIGNMEGFSYIQYIAPGLIMMQIITSAYSGTVSSFFIAKFQRQIHEVIVTPISAMVMMLGYVAGGLIRGMIIGLLVAMIALCFSHIHIYSLLTIIGVVFGSAFLFSLAGLINAIYARTFDDIIIVPTFILTPLTYLGGVFYSISLLPKTWQYFSLANPIVYIINAFRYGFLGITDASISVAFTIISLFVVILFIVACFLIKKGTGFKD